jgi:hypothetical protein
MGEPECGCSYQLVTGWPGAEEVAYWFHIGANLYLRPMIEIKYPETKPLIRRENGKERIFCMIRKRWMVITPEEWVRQNFLLYLTEVLLFPASLIAVEKQLSVGEMKKRFDIVVYDKESRPCLIVECKEMNVALSENVLKQALQYNVSIRARYLFITNGSHTMLFENDGSNFREVDKLERG